MLLRDLVEVYSPSGQEAAAVDLLTGWMAAHGFDAWVDEAGNACGVTGDRGAARTLLLLGHIDTVPGDIPVRIEAGKLYGRGTVDAKGPLCAFTEAAARAEIPEGWRVVVIGAVEEEIATSRGAHFVRDQCQPDLCVIGEPSGANRMTLGYKGRLIAGYTLERPHTHSAVPTPTVGALGAAFWQRVEAWAADVNAGHERLFEQVTPNLAAVNTHTDGFTDRLTMTVGLRLPVHCPPDAAKGALESFAEGPLAFSGEAQAHRCEKRSPLVRRFLVAMRAAGLEPRFVLKTGTSDMNVVGPAWGCPMLAYGPGDSRLDHTPDEHIALAEYAQAVEVLSGVLEAL